MSGVRLKPGGDVAVWDGARKTSVVRWTGFARREIIDWWRRHGGELADVPARRFAERSGVSGELVWGDVPRGLVIRGVLDEEDGRRVLRIVTREAEAREMLHFQRLRLPLFEKPLFSKEIPPGVGLPLFESAAARKGAGSRGAWELPFCR